MPGKAPRRSILKAALSALFLGGCGKGGKSKARDPFQDLPYLKKPCILLVVLDTLRWDHVSFAGKLPKSYENLTPVFDSLARKGIFFRRAYANAPWTLPSHASLFTGFEPQIHRLGHNAVVKDPEVLAVKEKFALVGRFRTLASVLRELGYQTLGISQNPWVGPLTTLDYGFDHFYALWDRESLPFPPRKGEDLELDKVTYACRYFLKNVFDPKKPLFIFVNYITCHLPYQPAWPFRRRYVPGFPPDYLLDMTSHNWLTLQEEGKLNEEAVDYLRKLYIAEVAEVDSYLGKLLRLLKEHLPEDLLAIVTSDHGECIGHHGFFDHQFNLYEDLLRVPLVLTHPKIKGPQVVEEPVQLSDLFPTLLGLLARGHLAQELGLPGSVLPLKTSSKKERPLFFLFRRGSRVLAQLRGKISQERIRELDKDLFGVTFKGKKLLVANDSEAFLFDLNEDPKEEENRIKQERKTAEKLFLLLKKAFLPAGLPLPRDFNVLRV